MRQDTQCTYKRNIEARSSNHCCSGKAISIAYYECVFVALVTQHAKCMSHIILPSMAYLAPPYLSTLSHKGTIFEEAKKAIEQVCVLTFPANLSETFLRRIRQDIIINVQRSSYKLRVILVSV